MFLPIEGPNDLNGRYLTEDVPCSLVAMVEVARLAGVSTPVMDSVVILASTLKSENYLESGRTLEKKRSWCLEHQLCFYNYFYCTKIMYCLYLRQWLQSYSLLQLGSLQGSHQGSLQLLKSLLQRLLLQQ